LLHFSLQSQRHQAVFPRKMAPQLSSQRDPTEQNATEVSRLKNTEGIKMGDLLSGGAVKPAPIEAAAHSSNQPSAEAEDNDSDPEYESVKILKGHPSLRDPIELPIIAKHADTGERKTLWAKMDTGSDANIIVEKVVERLGLQSKIISSHL